MKKTSLTIAATACLSICGHKVLAQNQTINGKLTVTQGATIIGQTQIGDANNHSGFFTNGPSYFGTSTKGEQMHVYGDAFFHNNLNISGALGTTNVNGNMMLHKDVFVDGTTWLGNTNIGNASSPKEMTVYGNFSVGSAGNQQQTVLNGPLYVGTQAGNQQSVFNGSVFIGTPQVKGLLNVDGDASLHNNLRVDEGTTLLGNAQVGDASHHSQFIVHGPTFLGTPQPPQEVNVDGGVFLHNNLRVDQGTTLLGNAQIGDATHQAQLTVNGLFGVGTKAKNQQSNFNGGVYVGTPEVKGFLNVDGGVFLHDDVLIDDRCKIGNVTINATKFAQYRLWVQQGVVSEDYAIAPTTEWADFVFGEGYKLPSLKELENYIKANNHLPQVPTQAEVAKDGYSMRQLNSTLLQKVEELTLYTIEQDKKLEALTTELAEMKAVIEKLKK